MNHQTAAAIIGAVGFASAAAAFIFGPEAGNVTIAAIIAFATASAAGAVGTRPASPEGWIRTDDALDFLREWAEEQKEARRRQQAAAADQAQT